MLEVKDVRSPLKVTRGKTSQRSTSFIETKTTGATRDLILAAFDSGSNAVALVGPKGCYKSATNYFLIVQTIPSVLIPGGLF